ncbi:MAG: WecB/TagA/CpsF family glycosyltransferase [Methylococcales bacterium]|nr:WecB/TagA/CpsF family glycosyltransferase [Methylococcales bacterium]
MTVLTATNFGIKPYTFGRLPLHTGNLPELDAFLQEWMRNPVRQGRLVGFLNPHVYNFVHREPVVRNFLRACDLVCIDGIGVSLMFRILFGQAPPRVVATTLFDTALDWPFQGINAVFIGGTPQQAKLAAEYINARRGAWRIAGAFHGFLDADAYKDILRQHSGVDVVLVGAGTPKSEKILLDAREICSGALCWHIGGGTVGVYAGEKHRAPAWVSTLGVEWIHRFIHEPHYRSRVYPGAFEFASHVLKERFFADNEVEP